MLTKVVGIKGTLVRYSHQLDDSGVELDSDLEVFELSGLRGISEGATSTIEVLNKIDFSDLISSLFVIFRFFDWPRPSHGSY